MGKKNIIQIFEENQQYATCNIEFEPFGEAEDGVDFHPALEMQKENSQLREKLDTLIAFIKGEWQDSNTICSISGIEFNAALGMFDFSRTVEWNPPPLNGQKVTTTFRSKEIELRAKLKDLELDHADLLQRFQARKYYQQDLRREMIDMLTGNISEACRKKFTKIVIALYSAKVIALCGNLDDQENIKKALVLAKNEIERMYSRDFYREALDKEDNDKRPDDFI